MNAFISSRVFYLEPWPREGQVAGDMEGDKSQV